MKAISVRAALACLAMALSTTTAIAIGEPIPGIDIVVKCDCPNHPKGIKASTSGNGEITLKDLAPGDYVIEVDGKSLMTAMDKLVPAGPARTSGGSSFSLGIGGLFGGGSRSSREEARAAGPATGQPAASALA